MNQTTQSRRCGTGSLAIRDDWSAGYGVVGIPSTPAPALDTESIEPPWQAIREWIPDDDAEPGGDLFDQRPDSGKPVEIPREDGLILVLDLD